MPNTRPAEVVDNIYVRSTHHLAQTPEAAAACISKNATQAGYFPSLQPLYGTSAMSVSVRTFQVGDTLATFNLLPSATGTRATATTMRERKEPTRAELLENMIRSC